MLSLNSAVLDSCVAFVLAGGRGTRLHELTAAECKPAVSFAGSCRIIDFVLANVLNSGLRQAFVATQYRPGSLVSHIRSRWRSRFAMSGGAITTLSSGGEDEETGYKGTADAVYRNIAEIDARAPRHVLVLAADHVYQMDYGDILAAHLGGGADVTIAADIVPSRMARDFGVLEASRCGRIVDFAEKPAVPASISDLPGFSLASMGIYVFDWLLLREVLIEDAADRSSSHDFGRDVLPKLIARGNAFAHRFTAPTDKAARGYWRDVGTLDALHEANMDLLRTGPARGLDFEAWPLHVGWTGNSFRGERREDGSLVYPGSEPAAAIVRHSVVGPLVSVGAGASVVRSVLMPGVVVDGRVRLHNAIVAPGVRISGSLVVGEDSEEDALWFRRTSGGVVLIDQQMLERREDARRITRRWSSGMTAPAMPGRSKVF